MADCTIATAAATTAEYTRKGEGDAIELADGRLLLAYTEFRGDGSDVAPTRLATVESKDGGLSWERHRVVAETDPGDVNVYSSNLVRALDGGILLVFMRQHSAAPPSTTHHVWKSTNEGESFAPDAEFATREIFSLCNGVIKRLGSGRLLLPTCATDEVGEGPYGHTYTGAVLYSDDDGRTWQEAATRVHLPMRGVMEPHVEETGCGRVLMVMRSQLGALFLSESRDEGLTWSKPQTSGLRSPESCPELSRVPDSGDLLMIWNNSPYDPAFSSHYGKRSPLTAAISTDGGGTWGSVRDIEDDPSRAFSNPGCRFTGDGRAIINYWTCEYQPNWRMQDVIDLRVAVIDTDWFYGR